MRYHQTRFFLPLLAMIFISTTALAAAGTDQSLTNDNVIQLLLWRASTAQIVSLIERNVTRFDLTSESISELKGAGASAQVLDAMWRATIASSTPASRGSTKIVEAATATPQLQHSGDPFTRPSGGLTAEHQRELERIFGGNDLGGVAGSLSGTPQDDAKVDPAAKTPHPHTAERLLRARVVSTNNSDSNYPRPPQPSPKCAPDDKNHYHVTLDWQTGSNSPARVDHNGNYCFELSNANNILYSYSFVVNRVQEAQGSDLDALKGAMTGITGLFGGTPQTNPIKTTGVEEIVATPVCSLIKPSNDVKLKAAVLDNALASLDPGKKDGKSVSVPLASTLAKWEPVPPAFLSFEQSISRLIVAMNGSLDHCSGDEDEGLAESLVLDHYIPARMTYVDMKSHAESDHIERFKADLENISAYDAVVKEFAGGQQTTAEAKTFHLEAGESVLNASAGFLLTQVQARSYSSRTAPDPKDPTKTQSVLGIDGNSGIRPALTALLNYNIPLKLCPHTNFAISAGPVFDISNGKADTSRLGFMGGLSLNLWDRLFLTPGVHVGEFADFPQGFSHAGQPIPPNTGTPMSSKRFTARFAFAITFKVANVAGGNSRPSAKTPASQPKAATP